MGCLIVESSSKLRIKSQIEDINGDQVECLQIEDHIEDPRQKPTIKYIEDIGCLEESPKCQSNSKTPNLIGFYLYKINHVFYLSCSPGTLPDTFQIEDI